MRLTQAIEIFGNVSTPFFTLAIPDFFVNTLLRSSRGTPPSGFKPRRIAKYSDFDLWKAISRKRSKICYKLLLITNRKYHMSFRLLPNSVTLNNLERRNSPNVCVISPNTVAFRTDYVNVVGDTPHFLRRNVGQRIKFLAIYHLRRYWQGITPSENVKMQHSTLASEHWTIG